MHFRPLGMPAARSHGVKALAVLLLERRLGLERHPAAFVVRRGAG
jgi:hypothetical protein